MDVMGYNVSSALVALLAVGSYRHDRRERMTLEEMHRNLATAVYDHYRGASFATGILARLELASGSCAGPTQGIPFRCSSVAPIVGSEQLEPGDFLLAYTDGVSEARSSDGIEFGVQRLIDLVDRNSFQLSHPQRILQTLLHGIREHINGDPRDHATFLLKWKGLNRG